MVDYKIKKQVNMPLFIIAILLILVGVLLVYDASYARALKELGNSSFYGNKQLLHALLGIFIMLLIMAKLKYWIFENVIIRSIIYFGSIILLVLVYVPGIGVEEFGSRRWINIAGQNFQPSEVAKISLIIIIAYMLSRMKKDIVKLPYFLSILAPVAISVVIILLEDMGTAIVLSATILIMLFMAGARIKHIVALILIGGIAGSIFVLIEPYRIKRLVIFLNPFADAQGDGYQICQSLIAIGSGGLWGMGICEGRQKLMYLPAEHTDFIFAVLGQEVGFIGVLLLIALFTAFGIIGYKIALQTKDLFGKYLAGGITIMICSQAFLNMAVATATLPATGVPLPFISYGGTSLILNLICVGILLAISKYPGVSNEYKSRANRRGDRRTRVSRDKHSTYA